MNVLVVSAHPDDEYLGAGGTVIKHLDAGDQVTVIIVCEGVSVREHVPRVSQQERCLRAAAFLGLRDVRILGYPDQRLDTVAQIDLNAELEALVAGIRPEIVYTHFWGDINRDHQVIAESMMVALRAKPGQGVRRVFMFETPSSTEWSPARSQSVFLPNWYVDISAQLERKLGALNFYDSEMEEFPHPRSLQALGHRARHWGSLVGVLAAEPFVLVRGIG